MNANISFFSNVQRNSKLKVHCSIKAEYNPNDEIKIKIKQEFKLGKKSKAELK